MENPIKVLHVSRGFSSGGAAKAAFRLHEALLAKGIKSYFISLDDKMEENQHQANLLSFYKDPKNISRRIQNKIKSIFPSIFKSKKDNLREDLKKILPNIKAELVSLPYSNFYLEDHSLVKTVDVINLHWVSDQMLDYERFFSKCAKPVVWTLHDMNAFQGLFHYENDAKMNYKAAQKIEDIILEIKKKAIRSFKQKMHIATPSRWLAEQASKSEIFSGFPITAIANSLDFSVFHKLNKKEIRKELGLPQDAVILLFVAESLSNYRKGFDLLLEALTKVETTNIKLLALGDEIKLLPTTSNIISAGRVIDDAQMAKYYSAADAFILPSREDNLPNVMLESLACGLPVIGFPVGGIKEHIHNYKTGLLATEVSSDALATAISEFIKNVNLFDQKVIQDYAVQYFNSELQANKYIQVYKELTSKN